MDYKSTHAEYCDGVSGIGPGGRAAQSVACFPDPVQPDDSGDWFLVSTIVTQKHVVWYWLHDEDRDEEEDETTIAGGN